MTNSPITAARFVRIWQSAKTVAEVARRCGCEPAAARSRARYYRTRHGVTLKRFPGGRGSPVNGRRLAEIAKSTKTRD